MDPGHKRKAQWLGEDSAGEEVLTVRLMGFAQTAQPSNESLTPRKLR